MPICAFSLFSIFWLYEQNFLIYKFDFNLMSLLAIKYGSKLENMVQSWKIWYKPLESPFVENSPTLYQITESSFLVPIWQPRSQQNMQISSGVRIQIFSETWRSVRRMPKAHLCTKKSKIKEAKLLIDGLNINYASVGCGPHNILCLPGAIGKLTWNKV